MTAASYEFNAQQNEIFKGLVRNMRRSGIVVAIASMILFAYHLAYHFGISLGNEPSQAIYYIDLAIWFLLAGLGVAIAVLLVSATGAFTAVIKTEGNDVEHLMEGLSRLRGLLRLLFAAATTGSLLLTMSFLLLLLYS